MTTPEKRAEAEAASVAFHLALTQIGIGTIEEALDLWGDVNPAKVAPTAGRWLERAVLLVLSRRQWSRDLAFSYYRLVRALRTGATITDPYRPDEPTPTLSSLRRDFAERVDEVARITGSDTAAPPVEAPEAVTADDAGEDAEADRLLVEELEGLIAEEERLERAAEEEARIDLEALGPANLQSKLKDIGKSDAEEMDAIRDQAHREAGARQAAAAERLVMDGGRGSLYSFGRQDKRCIGWARVSKTGTPCGFCAMLISRGAYYRTKASAERDSEGDLYHDNCHCIAEQLFTDEQFGESLFDLNRQYEAEWKEVVKKQGLTGKDALNAWRRYINRQQGRTFKNQVA